MKKIIFLSSIFFLSPSFADEGILTAVVSELTQKKSEPDDNAPITTVADSNATNTDKSASDQDIHARITGIFNEIDGLGMVSINVNQGVVSLSGTVPNEAKAVQAVNLANRISDVVAVQDNINRTLSVQDNVTPVFNDFVETSKSWLNALPLFLVAILAFLMVAKFGSFLANRRTLWRSITPNPFVAELLSGTAKFVFIILGLILALSLIGAQNLISTLLGGAGVLGIAIGFAVKDTIENYIASLMLSIRQPFRAKDHVIINDKEGIVVRLTSRATVLMTLDGNHLRIPNSEVFKGVILNYTKNPERRFTFKIGVDANNDPLAGIKVGLDAINNLDFVLKQPKAIAIINEIGDSNIILEFQVWVNQSKTDFAKARSIAIRETKHALENHGFSLPEPIYMVNFDQNLEDALIRLGNRFGSHFDNRVSDVIQSNPTDSKENQQKDTPSKKQAKARAKIILGNDNISDILNATPDPKIIAKVEEAILNETGEPDLLDRKSPQE